MLDAHQECEVVRGLREGRVEAWRTLYDAYAPAVWRVVARLLGPGAADVADVVQETFLVAARGAGGYDASRGSLWVWLGGIARNHVAIHYRRQARQDRIRRAAERLGADGFAAAEWLDQERNSPAESLDRAELAVLVRAALGGLPDEYSALLTGKYLDGSALDELAAERRVSLEAVRSKLARARRAFRKAFAKLGAQRAVPKNRKVPE